jgi:hypothetical protein
MLGKLLNYTYVSGPRWPPGHLWVTCSHAPQYHQIHPGGDLRLAGIHPVARPIMYFAIEENGRNGNPPPRQGHGSSRSTSCVFIFPHDHYDDNRSNRYGN